MTIAKGFFDGIKKIAGQFKLPSMRHIQLMKDPASSGLVRPVTAMRINGGAHNLGVTRPPTLAANNNAAMTATKVRESASRPKAPKLLSTV